MKKINLILLDIDGVVYDFVNKVLPLFKGNVKDSDIKDYRMEIALNISKQELWQTFDKANGIFCEGNLYPWANALIECCKKYCNNIMFCSNPGNNPKHWAEKKIWHEANFKDIPLCLIQDKYLLSNDNIVLIDDYDKNCQKFSKYGTGIGVVFPNYWNSLSTFTDDPVNYIDCTLEDINTVGFKAWKNIKNI